MMCTWTGEGRFHMVRKLIHPAVVACAVLAVTASVTAAAAGPAPHTSHAPPAATPIKHVIVIIGENHSFDNVFAPYPPPPGHKLRNLRARKYRGRRQRRQATRADLPGRPAKGLLQHGSGRRADPA